MKSLIFLIMAMFVAFASAQLFAQDSNSWGDTFACAVDWFAACTTTRVELAVDSEKRKEKPARTVASPSFLQQSAHQPEPVRNVLENPSPETARAYITWSRQANEKLAKATKYIAQASREMNANTVSKNGFEKSNTNGLSSLGPVGLYYFFSPGDQSASKDVAVLNKIWREGRLGVVGIPVSGKDEEVGNYVNEAKPLFPIRRSDAEVQLVKPAETPDLYLALPLEKKVFRLGPTITETAIAETVGNILVAHSRGTSTANSLGSDR